MLEEFCKYIGSEFGLDSFINEEYDSYIQLNDKKLEEDFMKRLILQHQFVAES